jgi:hypothetical protein
MRITHIAPLSVGKVAFVLYGCIGLIACIFFVPVMLFGTMMNPAAHRFPGGALFVVALVIGMPIFYATIGSLFAMLAVAIYNVVAGMVGGVELTIEPTPSAR